MRLITAILGAIAILITVHIAMAQTLPGFTPDELSMTYSIRDDDGVMAAANMSLTIGFYDDGQRLGQVLIHDVKPYLTTQEKQQLAAMMERLRTSAEGFYLE